MEQTTTSSGSTGGYSYGSTGGTATYETVETPSYGSTGGSGSYSAPQAPAATVPLSSAKGPRCQCGAACECVDCDCQTALCRIPKDLPHTATCRVPRLVTTATCRVPVSGPSVEAVAAL